MATTEQPLKKRKLYEPVLEPQSLDQSSVSPLSQEEVMRKKQNKEEIKSLYECYKRIKLCISRKDYRFMPDFEQAYLSLITASRGCRSTQRIVAELIPRYASYCPTALEAAAKVAINMYNWSLAAILREEDHTVAFQTAKACIFGLIDICCTASSEAPTSSVMKGICSAVFLNVLTFFVNSFEGKNIYDVYEKDIAKVQGSLEHFSELKQDVAEENESTLLRLFKFRALSLLRIFFTCPKDLLGVCLELFKSSGTDFGLFKEGSYFLRQVTTQFDYADATQLLEKTQDDPKSSRDSVEETTEGTGIAEEKLVSNGSFTSEVVSRVPKGCLLGMVLNKDPSLRGSMYSKYNQIRKSLSSEAVLEISSVLEGTFGSFSELVDDIVSREDIEDDRSIPSKHTNRQHLTPEISNQSDSFVEQSGRDSRVQDTSGDRDQAEKVAAHSRNSCNSAVPFGHDIRSVNENSNYDYEGSRSMKNLETRDCEESCRDRPSMRNNGSNELLSPAQRKPLDPRNDALDGVNHVYEIDNQQTKTDFLQTRPTSGVTANILPSPEQHSAVLNHSTSSTHNSWHFDGDPTAMDVFSASTQLWLGSLGPGASDSVVRFQFEKFGPIERFLFYPTRDFALVDYRHIMDAIKAREYMRGSCPWGAYLRIKFLDVGLGSRGSINGVAVGSSCQIYVGSISSQWAKDEILHELARVGFRAPRMVTDLTSENAFLIEYETAEEASTVMVHLRQYRRESGFYGQVNRGLVSNAGITNVTVSQVDGRFVPTPNHLEYRSSNLGSMPNSMIASPHVSTVQCSPIDNRKSQLSSLLSSLSLKYNISQSSTTFGGNIPSNYNVTRDEDNYPTSTLWISLPDGSPQFLTDDDLMSVCHVAAGNLGSVVRLTRSNLQTGSCWFVELSTIDAAISALRNLRSCQESFFQITFSQPGSYSSAPFVNTSESTAHERVLPSTPLGNHETIVQSGNAFPSNWTPTGYTEMETRKTEDVGGYDNNREVSLSHPETYAGSHGNEQVWMYNRPEMVPQFSVPPIMPCPPMATQGPAVMPPQQVQPPAFVRPIYPAPHNSWGIHGLSPRLPMNQISPGVMVHNHHVNVPPPFLPPSVTPLAPISGNSTLHSDMEVTISSLPPASSPPPPPPDMPPPEPPSPPPLPFSQPPLAPPPPSSPPLLQPSCQASTSESIVQCVQYQWQGVLCKSGVNYCTIYARREELDSCKYSNSLFEPTEWPARLDVTKRTDFQHVKSTFTSTPPHKREVCQLLPSTSNDHKGFQDFVSYLKQRECAGVIKIPAVKSMWGRLLFILPSSPQTCSMLGMVPHPSEGLIALVLPKETSFEWV